MLYSFTESEKRMRNKTNHNIGEPAVITESDKKIDEYLMKINSKTKLMRMSVKNLWFLRSILDLGIHNRGMRSTNTS